MKKLLLLQQAIKPIPKDSENPFFKSKYFDINTMISEIKPIIDEIGIIIVQPLSYLEGRTTLKTKLIDAETGEIIIETEMLLPENNDPQKMGSIITYFRRYALQSLLFLQAEDDDANSSSGTTYVSEGMQPAVEDNKQWITDVLFKDAIKKSLEAGVITINTPVSEVIGLLRKKYKVARKYETMVTDALFELVK